MDRPAIAQVAALSVLAFLVIGSYELARTASESLFLADFGERGLPWVWLGVALGAGLSVAAYRRFLRRAKLLNLLASTALVSLVLLLGLLMLARTGVRWASFGLYIWKDIYVVVLVEIFWSHANSTFDLKSARNVYWLFCMMGSIGGAAGNLLTGEIAHRTSTAATLWGLPPLLLAIAAWSAWLARRVPFVPPIPRPEGASAARRRLTPDIALLVALVATVQLVITLLDYRYNAEIKAAFPDTDDRTRVVGWVYSAVNLSAFVLQAGTAPLLRLLKVRGALLASPVALFATLLGFMLFPQFALLAIAKVVSKAFDYSIGRAAKELFYIPLTPDERVGGKSIVDIFTYRSAKAGASLLLLGLAFVALTNWVLPIALALCVLWLALAVVAGKRHVGRSPE